MTSCTRELLLLALLLAPMVAGAQGSPAFQADALHGSEAQRRAQTGFPRIDAAALEDRAPIRRGYANRRAGRYVAELKRPLASAAGLVARFEDSEGREVFRSALQVDAGSDRVSFALPTESVIEATTLVRLIDSSNEKARD